MAEAAVAYKLFRGTVLLKRLAARSKTSSESGAAVRSGICRVEQPDSDVFEKNGPRCLRVCAGTQNAGRRGASQRRLQSNTTPTRFSLRHTTWQGRLKCSAGILRFSRSGRSRALITSSDAPDAEMFLTTQLIAPPPLNSIVPVFKTL